VINLAAGLDARPYRMRLPSALKWVEVDLPDVLAYKEEVLGDAKPSCSVERVALDLADAGARRELFASLAGRARRVMILTEGLLIYLAPEEVAALAKDLAAQPSIQRWAVDLASPRLLEMLRKKGHEHLAEGGATLKFGPAEGTAFFAPYGWSPRSVGSMLKTAAKLKRLPFFLRLLSLLPENGATRRNRPWGGACLLGRNGKASAQSH